MPIPWVYRSGVSFTDKNGHRCLFSETFVSEQPPDGHDATAALYFASQLAGTLADPSDTTIQYWPKFGTLIYPQRFRLSGTVINRQPAVTPLNPNAPEAAARLQRVGANGGLGRTAYPILDDSWYLDLPHRRHVDVDMLQQRLDTAMSFWVDPLVLLGRTYRRCIFHRKTGTWEPVVAWRVLPNPIRIWQRWRTFPQPKHTGVQGIYRPDEVT